MEGLDIKPSISGLSIGVSDIPKNCAEFVFFSHPRKTTGKPYQRVDMMRLITGHQQCAKSVNASFQWLRDMA